MADILPDDQVRITTINHIGIPIKDRRTSLRLYRDVLGLNIIPAMELGSRLIWTETLDHTMVHVIEGAPIPHVAFEVEDFDAALRAVRAAGIKIIKGPLERADGQRAFYCLDPDGNRLEFNTPRNLKPLLNERSVDDWGYTTEL